MKSFLSTLSVLALATFATSSMEAGDVGKPCSEVPLAETDCGSECVMLFGRVGEGFRYDLAEGQNLQYVPGRNASGEVSALPRGLRFDGDRDTVVGVPMEPGFHEFVLVETANGESKRKVMLLDIQDLPVGGGSMDYASYFSNGLR